MRHGATRACVPRPATGSYTAAMSAAPTPMIALKLAAALAAFLLAAAAPPARAAPAAEVIVGFKPGAEVLRWHPMAERVAAAQAQRVLQQRADRLGLRLGRALQAGPAVGRGAQVLRAEGMDAVTLARRLAADPDVAYAQPNGRKRLVTAPNDPLYPASSTERRSNGSALQDGPASGQWYLRAPTASVRSSIDIEAAWARTRGSAGVVVAVLDTGVHFDHPDLTTRLLSGYDFVSNATVANDGDGRDADPSDPGDWVSAAEAGRGTFTGCDASSSSWHGTATSSLVGAATDDGRGMAGAAPGVRVLPVRVLGKCYGTDSDIIAGMRWAAGLPVDGVPANPTPARVLNLSLGGSGACSAAYQAAVDEITARGVLVVAAAGNSVGGAVNVPANCRGVLGVVALRHVGSKVGFSDMGPEIGIAAPGGNCINVTPGTPCLYPILAATNTGSQQPLASAWSTSYDITVGTSFASPLVAAVAGLMASRNPVLAPAELVLLMKNTARPFPTSGADNGPGDATPVPVCGSGVTTSSGQCYCTTALCGAGMLDAGAAVQAAAALAAPGTGATIGLRNADPVAGQMLELFVTGSGGATPASYLWQLLDGGGAASAFSGATSGATAQLPTTGAGTVRVRLTVVDSSSASTAGELAIVVRSTGASGGGSPGGGDSGGGGVTAGWMAGLLLAVLVLGTGRVSARFRRA
jgi:serine protease